MATYVLLHGGWAGGWVWKAVGNILQGAGHDVYRPTLTGLGERVHLGNPNVSLDTHSQDIVNLFEYELLSDVILVGYSYSGLVITGVAERIPERLKELVYLDAFVPQDGQSLADLLPNEAMVVWQNAAQAGGNGWAIPFGPSDEQRLTPHPLKTYLDKVVVQNSRSAGLPRTFLYCKMRIEDPTWDKRLASVRAAAQRAERDPSWRYHELAAQHGTVLETHVRDVADLLMNLAHG
jgi:pimeloyl-ACP methyl ester carboxylesterase